MQINAIPSTASINLAMLVTIVIIVLGFALKYGIKRRAFYRRNSAGVETFNTYEKAVSTRILEGLGNFAAIFMIIVGMLVLFFLWWLKRQQ